MPGSLVILYDPSFPAGQRLLFATVTRKTVPPKPPASAVAKRSADSSHTKSAHEEDRVLVTLSCIATSFDSRLANSLPEFAPHQRRPLCLIASSGAYYEAYSSVLATLKTLQLPGTFE